MSIGKRLSQFIDYKKVSFREFDKKCDIGNGYSKKIINGDNSPSLNIVDKVIHAYPELSKNWLLTGEGKMIRSNVYLELEKPISIVSEPSTPYNPTNEEAARSLIDLSKEFAKNIGKPLIPIAEMNNWKNENALLYSEYYVINEFTGISDYLIRLIGVDFEPYNNGNVLACKHITETMFVQWGRLFAINTEQGLLIKKLLPGPDENTYTVQSVNSNYPPFTIPKNQVKALALIVGLVRVE